MCRLFMWWLFSYHVCSTTTPQWLVLLTDSVERKLATGDFKGRLQTWDLERVDDPLTSTPAHVGLINAIDGAGGKASILDPGQGCVQETIRCCSVSGVSALPPTVSVCTLCIPDAA
jgi:hypothetical protein